MFKNLVLLFILTISVHLTYGQKLDKCIHMCKIKDSIEFSYTSSYNNKKLFRINKGQYFLYDDEIAYLPNGKYGNLPQEAVQYLDSIPPFKMLFWKSNFVFKEQNEYRKEIKEITKIDFALLLEKALNGDIKSFDKFLGVYDKLDGDAAEFFDGLVWGVMNYVGDNYIFKYLSSPYHKNSRIVCRYFTTEIYARIPICDKPEYCKLYFPKSFKIMNDNL